MRERRKVPRYVCNLKGELAGPGNSSGSNIEILTLSIKGSCVQGVSALKRGQKCVLKIKWESKALQAEGKVAWIDIDKGQAGLQFLSLGEDAQSFLKELCSTLKLQPIQPPEPPSPTESETELE